jgi:hypothetical protein
MVLPDAVQWEHDGMAVVAGIAADCPTTTVEVNAVVPQVACRTGGTLVGHLLKVLT